MQAAEATSPTPAYATLMASMDAIVADGVDIVPLFFARFFRANPGEQEKFHNKVSSHGNMVNEIMGLLLAVAAEEGWVEMFTRAQLRTHEGYGEIALERYREALAMFVDVLGEAAGPRWTPEWDQCWREQAARLMETIERWY